MTIATMVIPKAATILVFLLLLGLVLIPGGSRAQAPLRIAYTEFAPFHSRGPDGDLQGFFYEIITEAVEKRLGIRLIWTPYPWIRCQRSVRAGTDDALLTVPTSERLTYLVTHPTPFYEKRMHIFTQPDHPKLDLIRGLTTIADIKDNALSTITYGGHSWHKTHVTDLGILTYETNPVDNVWRMLAARRADLVLEWPHGAWPAIRRLDLEKQIVDSGVILTSSPFHLLIRKGSLHVNALVKFEAIIAEMKADGTIATILAPFEGG